MTSDPRIHAGRRTRAIDRLRGLTTGAAVAGVAGTAGFGLLAAATWTGTPGATTAADVDVNAAPVDGTSSPNATITPNATTQPTDPSGSADQGSSDDGSSNQGSTGGQPVQPVQPVQPGSGRSHATTGGSH